MSRAVTARSITGTEDAPLGWFNSSKSVAFSALVDSPSSNTVNFVTSLGNTNKLRSTRG
eukprot:m.60270 g.60270  ORF g.60270 m.60270 type:complete len:59 (-) comp49325_c0_seq2:502-678(-)